MDELLTLTIRGTASQLAVVLAALNGTTALTPPAPALPGPVPFLPPMPSGGEIDDDDAGTPAVVAPGQVDGAGFPWDERIHSGSKKTKADGTWNRRKGVDAATIAAVEAELRAAQVVPVPAPVPGPAPVMPPMPAPVPMPTPQPAPVPMPAPQPLPVEPTPAALPNGQIDFNTFMQNITVGMTKPNAQGAPTIDALYLAQVTQEVATAFGSPLTVITDIGGHARAVEMSTYAMQCLQRDQRWS